MLYDGDCPLCRREVEFLRKRNHRGRLAFEDISCADFQAEKYGRTQQELMARIHGVLPGGEVVEGVEVFRRAYEAVGLGFLLAASRLPLLRSLFDFAYSVFARNRIRLGRLFGNRCEDGECRH